MERMWPMGDSPGCQLTEYLLSVSRDLGRQIKACHKFLVAVAECTEGLDYGPKEVRYHLRSGKVV